MTPRDIEKLKAIGYDSWYISPGVFGCQFKGRPHGPHFNDRDDESENGAWVEMKRHAQSPDGLKATMADKVRWLQEQDLRYYLAIYSDDPHPGWVARFLPGKALKSDDSAYHTLVYECDSPEAAVDALFWKVP